MLAGNVNAADFKSCNLLTLHMYQGTDPSAQAIPKCCRVHSQLMNFSLPLPARCWVLLSLTSSFARNVLYAVASDHGDNAGLPRRKLKRFKLLSWEGLCHVGHLPMASAPKNTPRNAESLIIPAKARGFETLQSLHLHPRRHLKSLLSVLVFYLSPLQALSVPPVCSPS